MIILYKPICDVSFTSFRLHRSALSQVTSDDASLFMFTSPLLGQRHKVGTTHELLNCSLTRCYLFFNLCFTISCVDFVLTEVYGICTLIVSWISTQTRLLPRCYSRRTKGNNNVLALLFPQAVRRGSRYRDPTFDVFIKE